MQSSGLVGIGENPDLSPTWRISRPGLVGQILQVLSTSSDVLSTHSPYRVMPFRGAQASALSRLLGKGVARDGVSSLEALLPALTSLLFID